MWPDDFDIDTNIIPLENATVVVRGKHAGEDIVLEADVASIAIQGKSKRGTWSRDQIFANPSEYRLNLKPQDDGVCYTVKTRPVKVSRTARCVASDRTVESVEKARVACGAPTNAKFRYSNIMHNDAELQVRPWDEPKPVEVEFYWEEHS